MMANLDLHFGAGLALDVGETVRQARWMENLGYEYFSVGEHFMRGDPPGPTHAALPVLAVAAGATDQMRVLSSIILTPFYHPLFLARTAATLDAASGGRLTLGVGVGGEFPVEFEAAGLRVNQRGRRTDECLEVMRKLWTGEKVTFSGRHFQLTDAMINPSPVQKPNPPVWVSGRRDAAMARAAKFGDGWMPYFYDAPRYRDSVGKIKGFAAEAGRDISGFQWAHFPYIAIYPTEQQAAEVAAEQLGGRYLYGGEFLDIVRKYCLLGTVENCIEQLQEYIDAGARHIIFSISCPREDRERHLETIAKELIPHFRNKQA
ncbi:MAG: LLM class flavin-dependent oxidoreductase [Dehalococcoidia bacterium]|jgi:probable F420-dependent oxidoreductase|nr:LLM class flavin-dependent oxidoreductase [Dehalococcoidia bacterium]